MFHFDELLSEENYAAWKALDQSWWSADTAISAETREYDRDEARAMLGEIEGQSMQESNSGVTLRAVAGQARFVMDGLASLFSVIPELRHVQSKAATAALIPVVFDALDAAIENQSKFADVAVTADGVSLTMKFDLQTLSVTDLELEPQAGAA